MFDSTFSKNYTIALRQLCSDNFGKYIEGKYGKQDSVEITYHGYDIIFDSFLHFVVVSGSTSEIEFQRVRVEFCSPDKLSFKIIHQGLLEVVQKLFGGQDIKIGNAEFDSKFVVKGNNEYKIQYLLSDVEIQKLLLKLEILRLEISENKGFFGEIIEEGHSVLYLTSDKEPKNIKEFNMLLELFKLLIDNLKTLGSSEPIK